MKYTVLRNVRARGSPSIFGLPFWILPSGYTFESNIEKHVVTRIDNKKIESDWVQLPDGKWAAKMYKNTIFMECNGGLALPLNEEKKSMFIVLIDLENEVEIIENVSYAILETDKGVITR